MLIKFRNTVSHFCRDILSSLLALMIIVSSCERLEIKRITKVSTGSVSQITASSSMVQGNVIEQGETGIKQHGHCWSVTSNPSVSNDKTELGPRSTTGTFNSPMVELSPNTKYYVRAYATDNEGISYGDEISFTTSAIPVPAAPANLVADAESSSQITISWTDNSNNEEGFKIERSPNGTTDWVEIAIVGAGITNFQNINLNPSTPYYYRVRAYNPSGNSDYSIPASATTFVNVPIPTAPTYLSADAISGSEIYLSWTDNSNNEEGFKIERAGASMNWREIAAVGVDTTTFLDIGLTASVTYYYRVRSFNAGGNSNYSNTADATTLSDATVPLAPSGLSAETKSDTEISINWTDNSDNEDGFKIEYSLDGVTNWNEIGTTGTDVTAGDIIGLIPGTLYYFRVRAYNGTGDSDYSNTANATTSSGTSIPADPGYLTVQTFTSTRLSLWWVDQSDNEEGFKIERSAETTSNWVEIKTVGPGTERYDDVGLNTGYIYYYRVRAYNSGGNSGYSNTADAITCLCPMGADFNHIGGDVAPVDKSIRYDFVMTNLTGVYQCWIMQNLGAHIHGSSAYDATEDNAGWYWQFNRKQGYKHDGSIRTPGTAWISSINENSDWTLENDPCNILLGSGWRIPTDQEWLFAYFNGGWSTFNNLFLSDLKLHAAGSLGFSDGVLYDRGGYGNFWSSSESNATEGQFLLIVDGGTTMNQRNKASGYSIRCVNDSY